MCVDCLLNTEGITFICLSICLFIYLLDLYLASQRTGFLGEAMSMTLKAKEQDHRSQGCWRQRLKGASSFCDKPRMGRGNGLGWAKQGQ